jgi:hypothetical protein
MPRTYVLFWTQSLRCRRLRWASVRNLHECDSTFFKAKRERAMPYSITLRSRTDARITGWYDASSSGGRPITTGRRSSTRKAMPDQYGTNCAALVPAMPRSSRSKQRWKIFCRHSAADVLALGQVLVEREAVGSLFLRKPGTQGGCPYRPKGYPQLLGFEKLRRPDSCFSRGASLSAWTIRLGHCAGLRVDANKCIRDAHSWYGHWRWLILAQILVDRYRHG